MIYCIESLGKATKDIEKWRDNAMIYCIESLGKATKDTESSDDEESE